MFLTVGIGASAGGLEAFKSFFAEMPAKSGMAFVLVQHLSPEHKSMLAELLDRTTPMDVIEAKNGVAVKPDCVFVIPPDATMTISDGKLNIVKPAPPRERRRPIDTFLESLAQDQEERAVAIILSGTGSDGTLGIATVKEHGGLTLAQAEYDSHAMAGMPESAANSGQVDDVLAVEAMPARILSHRAHLMSVADGKDDDGIRQDAASHLSAILRALHSRTGHDFSEYKEKTLVRRLPRRMQVLQVATPRAYMDRLTEHPEELDMLLREVLISVTRFFRDEPAFEALNETVLKPLVARRGADEDIRVWVPGCATGEEAYSIAILIREAMDTRRPRPKVQIFGTDLDERAIAKARLGRYRKPVAGLSLDRAERWFTVEGDDYRITPEIREMCVFSAHSVTKHPPFSKLDLISCRNLLIYLDASMQDRLMRTFHYGLNPDGKLFLGSSESVSRATNLFAIEDKKHRIFKRRDVPNAALPAFAAGTKATDRASPDVPPNVTDDATEKSIRRVMAKHYPPHILLDRTNNIVRFSGGSVGQYLEPSPGVASFSLFDILRKGLRPAARDVLQQIRTERAPVRRDDVPIRIDGKPRLVSLIAERLAEHGQDADLIILAIQDAGPGLARSKTGDLSGKSVERLQTLEQELNTTRTQLQSTIDELETANEEMKSSNEEYQSVNEELQSSNEELETTKEEMQSVNEELQTINTEIASKNDQLIHLNSDLSNLLESSDIATLFLDDHLRVRRFTRGVSEVFHLRDADIGRPITEIVSLLEYRDLQRDVKTVLRKLTPIEHEVTLGGTGTTFILRIRPYRTLDNVIDGVVMTFVDISERKRAEVSVRESEEHFRLLFDQAADGIFVWNDSGQYTDVNAAGCRMLGYQRKEILALSLEGTLAQGEAKRIVSEITKFGDGDGDGDGDGARSEWRMRRKDGSEFFAEIMGRRLTNGDLQIFARDVSDRKRHEDQQELLLQEMDHRIKNLFAVAGGIVMLSAQSAKTPTELVAAVQGRLGAMAKAHNLVRPRRDEAGSHAFETTLGEIVRIILEPHIAGPALDETPRAIIDGPEVMVGGDAVASLAMVLHELATNAAKYGALSAPGGSVHTRWVVKKKMLEFDWVEHGGPPIASAPETEGFGSSLARGTIDGQLDGTLSYRWNPDGLAIHLSISMERLVS